MFTTATLSTLDSMRAVALEAEAQYPLPFTPTMIRVLRFMNSRNFSKHQTQHLGEQSHV